MLPSNLPHKGSRQNPAILERSYSMRGQMAGRRECVEEREITSVEIHNSKLCNTQRKWWSKVKLRGDYFSRNTLNQTLKRSEKGIQKL